MFKIFITSLVLILFQAASAIAMPHEGCGEAKDCAKCHNLSVNEANTLLAGLGEVKSVKISAVKGLYELTMEYRGRHATAYLDFGKRYLVAGPIFDIKTKKAINQPPEQQPSSPSKIDINSIPTADSIVMGNPQGKKKLFVFTDPECPFCARLHHELVKLIYMEPDLAIYVKMFPLKIHPKAFDMARVIMGADNPLYMLDKAFAGEPLPAPGPKDSAKPVEESLKFAESIGVNSTPTMVLPDGRIEVGFRDAADIKKLLSGGK